MNLKISAIIGTVGGLLASLFGGWDLLLKTLPWDHRGWHCGMSGNGTHIGVEMCEPACIRYTKESSFTCSDEAEARAGDRSGRYR